MLICDKCEKVFTAINGINSCYCEACRKLISDKNNKIIESNISVNGVTELITKKFVHQPKDVRLWANRKTKLITKRGVGAR